MERYRTLTRRSLVVGGLQAGMIATLVGRMYYLQVRRILPLSHAGRR